MIGNIVKGAVEIAGGLVIVSFLLLIISAFIGQTIKIIKSSLEDTRCIKNNDIGLEIAKHLQEIEDKVNKGDE